MKRLRIFFVLFLILVSLAAVGALILYLRIPSTAEIQGCLVTKMYQVNLCPGSKTYVPLKQISKFLQKAIVLSEDSTFYQHKGFDWESIEKNARESWEKRRFKRGGSTITQQLAKNMFLNKDKTLTRKALEALITSKIEASLTKNEILERYLNVIEFGKNLYGIKAASEFYFKKSPANLNVPESAFLVLILPNPVKYSHSFFKKQLSPFAKSRLSRIVDDLYRYQRITEAEFETAMFDYEYLFGKPPAKLEFEPDENLDFETESESDTQSDTGTEKESEAGASNQQ
ncbi:MAG: transglycosylase domain-containing protein [Bdellovibrionaceae bacterium]|nr:transglycosylase domain-containing protein [Pseudobdellovibrionaceae bacterium]